jgi:hypothetical protein
VVEKERRERRESEARAPSAGAGACSSAALLLLLLTSRSRSRRRSRASMRWIVALASSIEQPSSEGINSAKRRPPARKNSGSSVKLATELLAV